MKRWIAERKLMYEVIATGEQKQLTVRIGLPYWAPSEPFASCPLELDGLFEHVADAKGIDLVHALQLASDLDKILQPLTDKYSFYWASGEPYFEPAD